MRVCTYIYIYIYIYTHTYMYIKQKLSIHVLSWQRELDHKLPMWSSMYIYVCKYVLAYLHTCMYSSQMHIWQQEIDHNYCSRTWQVAEIQKKMQQLKCWISTTMNIYSCFCMISNCEMVVMAGTHTPPPRICHNTRHGSCGRLTMIE